MRHSRTQNLDFLRANFRALYLALGQFEGLTGSDVEAIDILPDEDYQCGKKYETKLVELKN